MPSKQVPHEIKAAIDCLAMDLAEYDEMMKQGAPLTTKSLVDLDVVLRLAQMNEAEQEWRTTELG